MSSWKRVMRCIAALPVKGYDLNSKAFAITEGVEPGSRILAEGAVLLNDRFAKQED